VKVRFIIETRSQVEVEMTEARFHKLCDQIVGIESSLEKTAFLKELGERVILDGTYSVNVIDAIAVRKLPKGRKSRTVRVKRGGLTFTRRKSSKEA